MLRSKSTLAVLLALSFFLERAQGFWWDDHVLIGFATLPEDQARRINEDNKPFVEENQATLINKDNNPDVGESSTSPRLPRLGLGLYLANKRKMDDIGKVYIPRYYEKSASDGKKAEETSKGWTPAPSWDQTTDERQELWGADEKVIVDYIKSQSLVSKPEKALRFSIDWQWQMLIPTKVVNGGDLDLWAKCYKSEKELVEEFGKEAIDWKSAFDIKGDQKTDWRDWGWN
ncbi:hypothetical protein LZ554_000252 [Drepanopeziza brunnea f. sp. 'monogermtubi']|nr:hypothetical protein LZ554_000252 [Drepanopeziza brunnea f. sp. 'monogermtubi']